MARTKQTARVEAAAKKRKMVCKLECVQGVFRQPVATNGAVVTEEVDANVSTDGAVGAVFEGLSAGSDDGATAKASCGVAPVSDLGSITTSPSNVVNDVIYYAGLGFRHT